MKLILGYSSIRLWACMLFRVGLGRLAHVMNYIDDLRCLWRRAIEEQLERRAALPRSSVKGQLASSDPVYSEPVTFQSYTIHNKLTAT